MSTPLPTPRRRPIDSETTQTQDGELNSNSLDSNPTITPVTDDLSGQSISKFTSGVCLLGIFVSAIIFMAVLIHRFPEMDE